MVNLPAFNTPQAMGRSLKKATAALPRSSPQRICTFEEVTFHKWVAGDKYPTKSLIVETGQEAADELQYQLDAFKLHQFNFVRQHSELNYLKHNLDSDTVIIQVDFAENYNNIQKNATQSSYFGHQSFTLYTACAWYKADGSDKLECSSFHSKYVQPGHINFSPEKVS